MRLRYQSYQERQATRDRNKKAKDQLANALLTFADVAKTIEDAFQPESEKLYADEIRKWEAALVKARECKGNYETLYLLITGHPYNREPLLRFHKDHPDYAAAEKKRSEEKDRNEQVIASYEYQLYKTFAYGSHRGVPYTEGLEKGFKEFAESHAFQVVEHNKTKLRAGIAKMLIEFKTCKVVRYTLRRGMKGFEGRFLLDTDKGQFAFECFSIWVWGILVESHARYLTYVKKPEALTHEERYELGFRHVDE